MLKALFKVFEIILLSLNSLFNVRRTIEEIFGTLQKCNVLTTKPEVGPKSNKSYWWPALILTILAKLSHGHEIIQNCNFSFSEMSILAILYFWYPQNWNNGVWNWAKTRISKNTTYYLVPDRVHFLSCSSFIEFQTFASEHVSSLNFAQVFDFWLKWNKFFMFFQARA